MKNIFDLIMMIEQTYKAVQRIEEKLKTVERKEVNITMDIQALIDAVAVNTDVTNSSVQAINGLIAAVEANINDPVALQAEVDKIKANTEALSQAIANVPAV